MDREQIEQFLNSLMGKRIVIKMNSDYCNCLTRIQPESIQFSERIRTSKVSDSYIQERTVSILDKNTKFTIEYEDIENVKYKDIDRKQFYELQLIYRDGTRIQFYSEEAF
jgi:hypothetical protein